MFDFVRQHKKIMQFLLVLLIFPSFVLFGIDGYNRFRDKGAAVAVIDGVEITQSQWDATHRTEADRTRNSMPNIDLKILDSDAFKYSVLDRMVRDRILQAAVENAKLITSDAKLAQELQKNPTIAALRKHDGLLDVERYKQLLAAQSMSPEMFEASIRSDLSVRQVMMGVSASAFAKPVWANVAVDTWLQQREVQVVQFLSSDYRAQIKPTAEQIQAFYDKNTQRFQSTEKADIEYVVLDLAQVEKTIMLNDADLKTYYQQNQERLSAKEERRASHILINAPQSASQADRQKAKSLADQLLQDMRKAPQTFADVAKKHSQDPGSATKGGDLDFFARGAMVKPFEDAVFALAKGDISDVVESNFGYHIIKLTDVKSPKVPSFEELRPKIETEVRKQQAQRKFAEVAEQFTNTVYEQSDSLQPLVEKLKLQIQKSSGLTRIADLALKNVLSNPELLNAIFSADSLDKKRNTEAVETAPNQLVSARVMQYFPAKTLALDEVKPLVTETLVKDQSAELAKKEGVQKLDSWKKGEPAQKLSAFVTLSRNKPSNLPPQLLDAVYRAPAQTLPAWVGVDLGEQGYAIARINQVSAATEQTDKKAMHERLQQLISAAESLSYYNFLKEKFKVQIRVPNPLSPTKAS
ncbi:MAG: peptidyl-prolyl cis-trans isomerase [Limnohabitans sp.]|nr:peptidyl-prolyl cis-trans isomerase [Limnohabitans sp.]